VALLPDLAAELVRLKVDVLVAEATLATRARRTPREAAATAQRGPSQGLARGRPLEPGHTVPQSSAERGRGRGCALGLQASPIPVQEPGELGGAFSAMRRGRVDALFVGDDPVFFTHRTRLLDLAGKSRLPTMFGWRDFAAAGGLMSYGPNFSAMFGRAAVYVDKILKGAQPGDLPVEQPSAHD